MWRPSTDDLAPVAIFVAVVGVFCTWTKDAGVTVNGTQGPHNGWLVVILAAPALLWSRSWSAALGSVWPASSGPRS